MNTSIKEMFGVVAIFLIFVLFSLGTVGDGLVVSILALIYWELKRK